MSEADAIDRVDEPVTVARLVDDLRELGVRAGDTLLVHSSLSAIGWVNGGPQAVVDALQAVLTDEGTLVMPTHSSQYTDPATWENPPVPDDWVEVIRETRPPYRPEVTPTRGMGAVPECFRNYPGVVRSRHPTMSFAAWGAGAEAVVADHSYDYSLGEDSPLARVYDRDGDVLLLGVGHANSTSLHLAEYRAEIATRTVSNSVPVLEDGERVVVEYEDIAVDAGDFEDIGADFEREVGHVEGAVGHVEGAVDNLEEAVGHVEGTVGAATAKLAGQPALVDFAVEWLERNR